MYINVDAEMFDFDPLNFYTNLDICAYYSSQYTDEFIRYNSPVELSCIQEIYLPRMCGVDNLELLFDYFRPNNKLYLIQNNTIRRFFIPLSCPLNPKIIKWNVSREICPFCEGKYYMRRFKIPICELYICYDCSAMLNIDNSNITIKHKYKIIPNNIIMLDNDRAIVPYGVDCSAYYKKLRIDGVYVKI